MLVGDRRITFNRDTIEVEADKVLKSSLLRWIETATPPPVVENNFNPVKFFLYQFRKNLYPFVYMRVMTNAKRKLHESLDSHLDELTSPGGTVEDNYLTEVVEKEIYRASVFFATNIDPTDRIVFKHLQARSSAKELAQDLFRNPTPTNANVNRATYLINTLRFRWACYIATLEILSDEILLKGFAKSPRLLKRMFKTDTLEKLPSKEVLMSVALGREGQVPKGKLQNWAKASKIDFHGKCHDHFVVYRSSNGVLYDHVTKQSRREARYAG
jgi:hypothetical protein